MPYYNNPGQVNDEALNIANGKTFQVVQVADSGGNVTGVGSNLIGPLVSGFTYPSHDGVVMTYTSGQLTGITHKSGSTTVSTVTITYDGDGNVTSILQAV